MNLDECATIFDSIANVTFHFSILLAFASAIGVALNESKEVERSQISIFFLGALGNLITDKYLNRRGKMFRIAFLVSALISIVGFTLGEKIVSC